MVRSRNGSRPVRNWIALALAALCGGTRTNAQNEPALTSGERAAIDAVVRDEMARHRIAGLALGIRRDGGWVLQGGYGLARIDPPSPVTAETRFQIASLTKPVTACIVLAQVAQGHLELDEPAGTYLTWLPEAYQKVTIRELLQHTAGLPRDLRTDNLDDFDEEEFRARLERAEPAFAPGTAFQYSNTGYMLLGFITEQATGRPFDALLRESLVEPLGLRATSYSSPPTDDLLDAVGMEAVEGGFRAAPYYSGGFAAGGLTSSLADLGRWLDALDRELLPEWARSALHSPAVLADGTGARFSFGDDAQASYGMGWFLTSRKGRALWTHGGAVSGFSCTVDRYPDDALLVIGLSNVKGPGTGAVAERIAELLLDAPGHAEER